MKRYVVAMAILLAGTLALTACQPIEMTARDAIVVSGGFLNKAIENHDAECQAFFKDSVDLGKSAYVCPAIVKGVAMRNLTIDALNIYCASPEYDAGTGPCVPNRALRPKLEAALRDLESIVAELKALGVDR